MLDFSDHYIPRLVTELAKSPQEMIAVFGAHARLRAEHLLETPSEVLHELGNRCIDLAIRANDIVRERSNCGLEDSE